jgi:hypothetical protein
MKEVMSNKLIENETIIKYELNNEIRNLYDMCFFLTRNLRYEIDNLVKIQQQVRLKIELTRKPPQVFKRFRSDVLAI